MVKMGSPHCGQKSGFCPGRVAPLVGVSSGHREVVGVIPSHGSCPGFRFHPGRGASRRLEKSLYRWAFLLGEMAKLCQAGQGGASLGFCPSSHQRRTRQSEPRLPLAARVLCPRCQQSEEAKAPVSWKGRWPVPCPSGVNEFLVVIFRMSRTVGGRGPLSPALAERIMGAWQYNAFSSSWPRARPVPLCGL